MLNKLQSRKLWVTLISGGVILANEIFHLNLPRESVLAITGVATSYVLGEAYVDSKKSK